MSNYLAEINLADIIENADALRGVTATAEEFLNLTESIRQNGVLNPIVVRELPPVDGVAKFGLIDGLQRFTASKEAGKDTIPANVTTLKDAEVLEAQIITNIHKIETKPVEYTKALHRILAGNPLWTSADLANKLSKSPAWIAERLRLTDLHAKIQPLVDEGHIKLANASVLAKLPPEEQLDWLERAQTESAIEFAPKVRERVKEIVKAKREGKDTRTAEFVPTAWLQKIGDLKAEIDSPVIAASILDAANATTALEGFQLGLKFCLHLDPLSIEAGKAKFDADKAKREEEKAARAAEREAKKKIDAEKKAAEAREAEGEAKTVVDSDAAMVS